MFRQAKADLLLARPYLGEGHLFDVILYKLQQCFNAWQIGVKRK
jgi:hypothetical protein